VTVDKQVPDISGRGGKTGNCQSSNKSPGQTEDRFAQCVNGKESEIALRESHRKLSLIVSTTRHDINNQLTILNGYLSLLEAPNSAMKTSDIISILQGASARIERILKFTREYQNIGEKPPAWQVLGETIRLAITTIETVSVRFTADPRCDEVDVYADPMMARVFYNLIDNSLRHGEKVSEIRISCSAEENGLVITYEDDGIGIPDKIRPVLFEQGKGKNTGYGLFLVREILTVTGITIIERGEQGKGVRFEIIVPSGLFRTTSRR
jgi:signal transduction histidine kinase